MRYLFHYLLNYLLQKAIYIFPYPTCIACLITKYENENFKRAFRIYLSNHKIIVEFIKRLTANILLFTCFFYVKMPWGNFYYLL